MLQLILFFGEVLYLKLLIVYNLNIAHTVLNSARGHISFRKWLGYRKITKGRHRRQSEKKYK